MHDGIVERLNELVGASLGSRTATMTTNELLNLFRNPPKPVRSVPREEAMAAIIRIFAAADEHGRRAILSRLSAGARNAFLGHAADLAVQAVRTRSAALIDQGLVALVIEDGVQDYRDSIMVLAGLYNSAVTLGMDAQTAFLEAAQLAEPGRMRVELLGFPLRQPADRDMAAFSEAGEGAEDAFEYKQDQPQSFEFADPVLEAQGLRTEAPQQAVARLDGDQQSTLIGFAGTLAEMAVRAESARLVEHGLRGLAIGGGGLDVSASLIAMAKLHHSAVKLG